MRVTSILLLIVLVAFVSGATVVTASPDGNAASPPSMKTVASLREGNIVTGPARLQTRGKAVLTLHPDSSLLYMGQQEGRDLLFLQKGIIDGGIHGQTSIGVGSPAAWVNVPRKDGSAKMLVRSLDRTHGFFLVLDGQAFVQELGHPGGGFPRYDFQLEKGQGIELWAEANGLGFSTRQGNPGMVKFTTFANSSTAYILAVPMATSGRVLQEKVGAEGVTRIASDPGSFRGMAIQGRVELNGHETAKLVAGPAAVVRYNNRTGKLAGYEVVKYQIVPLEISLTSEFKALATSNFLSFTQD
jgi:hypothetical protein